MTQISPKRAIFLIFPKNTKMSFFPTPKTRLSTKNEQILMNGLRKKANFWAFWGKMANFGQFLAKMGKTGIFSKKRLENFCPAYKP